MSDNLTFKDGNGVPFVLRATQLGDGSYAYFTAGYTAKPTPITGNQTLTLGSGADTTLTVPAGATHALGTVDSSQPGSARYWEDGSSPAAAAGWEVVSGGSTEFANLANVRLRGSQAGVPIQVGYRKYS